MDEEGQASPTCARARPVAPDDGVAWEGAWD